MTHTVMSEESKQILRSAQCARIIAAISEMHNITLQEAADIYYNSDTATLHNNGRVPASRYGQSAQGFADWQ